MAENRYPVFILSKGRFENCMTAKFMQREGQPFTLVVEAHEEDEYRSRFGDAVHVLPPESSGRGAIPVRNYIWELSKNRGDKRHWIFDDNIKEFRRLHKGVRIPCDANPAIRAAENMADRYTNAAIVGFNYQMFGMPHNMPPFFHNVRVYSAMLIDNSLPWRWRGQWNADTDLCLQVLTGGLCTILINAFLVDKQRTMQQKGGNTERYQGDGRLRMSRELERVWPGVATTSRRFKRPQHRIAGNWRGFDTPLQLDPDAPPPQPVAFKLKAVDDVQSPKLRALLDGD